MAARVHGIGGMAGKRRWHADPVHETSEGSGEEKTAGDIARW